MSNGVQTYYSSFPNLESIPLELRSEHRWVLWRYEERAGKATKIPYQPSGRRASSTDPQTWSSFAEVVSALTQGFSGLGFVLGEGWVGLDFDACLTSEIPTEVEEIVKALDGYTEVSPSGRGIHIICRGTLPSGPRRFSVPWAKGVEVYDQARFFTVTARTLHSGDLLKDQTEALAVVFTQLDFENFKLKSSDNEKTARLIQGDISGYPSHSEADLALCCYLLSYTGGDRERVDRLFRLTGLYRPKWDERHSTDGKTYGQITLERAQQGAPRATISEESNWEEGRVFVEGVDELFTDRNNARLLAQLLKGKALWGSSWGWCVWNGKKWEIDHDSARVLALARDLLPQYYLKRALEEPESRHTFSKYAVNAHSRNRIIAALDLARGDLRADPREFDRDPWLLNCENGVLDLRTGELLPHDPDRKISKICACSYDPMAKAPTWEKFISDITLGDRELMAFLQRALGYSITGDVREDKFFICWGSGANGKSTLLQTVRKILGNYAATVAPDAILKRRGDTHPTALADLHGVRFAILIETDEDQFLAEARVKALTGRDAIKARYLHKNYFEFEPQAKIWVASNHRPVVRDTSYAMWRRLDLIPFRAFFPPEAQDKSLPENLWAEREGILAWLVQGCALWQREGLREPQAVREETEAYKSEMDSLQDWLEQCCVADPSVRTPFKELYDSYTVWCADNDQDPLGKRAFGNRLTEKGFPSIILAHSVKGRKGLRLRQGDSSDSLAEVSINSQRLSSLYENIESSASESPISNLSVSNREELSDSDEIPF
ncbi:MAG: phage/plasmid primase, P4 family [Candidatus Methanomethylicaceae archaeon]